MCSAGGCGDAVQDVLSAQQSALQTRIQFALAAKSLDAVKSQGEAIVQLVQAAASIGKAIGSGEQFDAQA